MNVNCKHCLFYKPDYEHSHVCVKLSKIVFNDENTLNCPFKAVRWNYEHDGIITKRSEK